MFQTVTHVYHACEQVSIKKSKEKLADRLNKLEAMDKKQS